MVINLLFLEVLQDWSTANPKTSRDQKADILFCINAAKEIGLKVIPYGAISKGLQGNNYQKCSICTIQVS